MSAQVDAVTDGLRVEVDGPVATLTLDRPESLNALTVPMKVAMRGALERLAGDRAVRAVILTGAGRAFCAGQDLAERALPDAPPLDVELRDRYNPNPALRNRAVVGMEIFSGLALAADHAWAGGEIYDPASGKTYDCTLALEGENRLKLRGYIGIPLLGRTTTWIRVGAANQMCQR